MRRTAVIRWFRGLLGVERHGQVGEGWPYRLVREQPEVAIAPPGPAEEPETWRAEVVDEHGAAVGAPLAVGALRGAAEAACEAHLRGTAP